LAGSGRLITAARSLGEVAMLGYKVLIGRSLHARTPSTQKTEAKVACKVINIMTNLIVITESS
jgi:hypothetical protein